MTLRRWLDDALKAAKGGGLDADVRGAGLLHLARVCTVLDRAEANQIFDEGIAMLSPILTSGLDQRWYGERVLLLGAVVRPERVRELVPVKASFPSRHRWDRSFE